MDYMKDIIVLPFKDPSGNFYFGCNNGGGITIFNPDSMYSDNPAPPIVLTDFKVSDSLFNWIQVFQLKKILNLIISRMIFRSNSPLWIL